MKLKKFKRNAVLITVIAFVCVAVYLNWSYNNKAAAGEDIQDAASVGDSGQDGTGSLYYTGEESEPSQAPVNALDGDTAEYFASARLTREQSRDSALAMLRETAESESAGVEAQTQAVAAMAQLSDNALTESEIENILIAKGFADCMVYIDAEDVSVIVPAAPTGLSESDVARITEVVVSETAMSPDNLKIIEVK